MTIEPKGHKIDQKTAVDKGLSLMQALSLAWQMGYLLAIPLIALALAGRLLDKKWDTSPLFLLIGIGLSIIISSILVAKKALEIIGEVSKTDSTTKTTNQ